MKKIIILYLIAAFAVTKTAGQSVSESKDNTNSILLNGSAITLKITDPSLKLDFQRKNLFKNDRNNGYIFGISAEGRNDNGIANIFDGGNLVPSGKLAGLLGLNFSNNVVESSQQIRAELKFKEKHIRDRIKDLILLKEQMEKDGKDVTSIKTTINDITDKELIPVLNEEVKEASIATEKSFSKVSVFLFGGISAKSFKHFIGYDTTNVLKSFKNENFRGGFVSFGINYQYRNLQFGVLAGYKVDDNQSLLSEKVYNYEKVTTTGNQTITEKKEIKAFAGDYSKASYVSLNIDFIANLSLDHVTIEQPRNYMLLNPYLHSKIGSSNKDLIPNTTDIGIGLYVFNSKSKILGGFYIELPDISNNIEKNKTITDQNIRPALQKLSFGIVTRFNLQSFMKFQE